MGPPQTPRGKTPPLESKYQNSRAWQLILSPILRLEQLREGGEEKEDTLRERGESQDAGREDEKEEFGEAIAARVARKAIAFDIDVNQSKPASSVTSSSAAAFDRDHLDDDIDSSNDGSNVVLKKLRERRAREREAREKAKLVFQRLQEQRKIQQRAHAGSRLTKHEKSEDMPTGSGSAVHQSVSVTVTSAVKATRRSQGWWPVKD